MTPRKTMSGLACGAVVVGFLLAVAAPAAARVVCTSTWVGPNHGAWTDPANWQPAGVPATDADVCIVDRPGPSVRYAHMRTLQAESTSLHVTGRFRVAQLIDLDTVTLSGTGAVSSRSGTLSGVVVGGSVSVYVRHLQVSGARAVCGGEPALCLNDSARVGAKGLTLHDGDIAGDTSARPAVSARRGLAVAADASDGSFRIAVPLTTKRIFSQAVPADPAGLVLTSWSYLDANGLLSGTVSGSVQLPRSVTKIAHV